MLTEHEQDKVLTALENMFTIYQRAFLYDGYVGGPLKEPVALRTYKETQRLLDLVTK